MLDNSQNPAQNDVSIDPQQTYNAADSVVKAPRKSWSLPTLERALLTVIGFFAYYLAFRFGRTFVEWQFGLTIVLAVVATIVIPVLSRENKRITSELNDKPFCSCFFCSLEYFTLAAVGLTLLLVVWISGKTTYKLIASLGGVLIIFFPILYLENERISSQLIEEITEPRKFRHALIFIGLAIIVGSVGWIVGTGMRTFIEIAVPKLTLL